MKAALILALCGAALSSTAFAQAASQCVQDARVNGVSIFYNNCDFPIIIAYCNGDECNRTRDGYVSGGGATDLMPAHSHEGFSRGAGGLRSFACRSDGTLFPFLVANSNLGECKKI